MGAAIYVVEREDWFLLCDAAARHFHPCSYDSVMLSCSHAIGSEVLAAVDEDKLDGYRRADSEEKSWEHWNRMSKARAYASCPIILDCGSHVTNGFK